MQRKTVIRLGVGLCACALLAATVAASSMVSQMPKAAIVTLANAFGDQLSLNAKMYKVNGGIVAGGIDDVSRTPL